MTSDRTRTCIHPLVSWLPPDLCLFFNPTFGSLWHCFSSCQIMHITRSPAVGTTFPFAYQVIWSGRQDSNLRPLVRSVYKIRTYDTSFIIQTHQFLSLLVNCNQNQCSSQLNYFPKCVVFYNTFFLFVAHSRIELLFQEWKSCGLTVSRVRHN